MIYQSLAQYYDLLVKDEEATERWVEFTRRYLKEGRILELACGSGEITVELSKYDYMLTASDLSESMLHEAKKKDLENRINFLQADMTDFHLDESYDGILCYCDSVNYLSNKKAFLSMIQCVKKHLKKNGWFLFDAHTLDRLDEFKEEYIEEGILESVPYQWTIQSDHDEIYHHFTFWIDSKIETEMHIQKVFEPEWMLSVLKDNGFEPECWTDFDIPGIESGEKVFIAARKITDYD